MSSHSYRIIPTGTTPALADLACRFYAGWDQLAEADDARDMCAAAVSENLPTKPQILTTSQQRTDPDPTVYLVPANWTRRGVERLPDGQGRKVERLAALDAWEAECAAAERASGLDQLEQEVDALEKEHHRLVNEIAAYPAVTVADIALKLSIADEWDSFTVDAAEPEQRLVACRLIAGAIRDTERMTAGRT